VNLKQRERQSSLAVNLGLVANLLLAASKTSIGITGHSPALLADGINSTSDVAYYLVVSIFIRRAGKPADTEHPYGHNQLESIAALIVGSFVITTAIAIFWNAINTVYDLLFGQGDYQGAALITLWVALLTIVIKLGLNVWTSRIGRQAKNPAVLALAYDHRNDVYSASAAAVGIFLGLMGYPWVDPLAAALVALVILRTGIQILRESTADLMDTVPGETLGQQVSELLGEVSGVKQIDEIHAHRFGPYLVINVTIGVDGSLSVKAGDEIACQVEQTLYQRIEFLRRVYVHYHPAGNGPGAEPGVDLICEPHGQQKSWRPTSR
jgi:cation diffusion facilitator family transporter